MEPESLPPEYCPSQMHLPAGTYLGESRAVCSTGGLTFTFLNYPARLTQPNHSHDNPSLLILISGQNQDQYEGRSFELPSFSSRFRPAGAVHASNTGTRGATALSIEWSADWLERHQLSPKALGPYRFLDKPSLKMASLRLVLNKPWLTPGSISDTELFELIEAFTLTASSPESTYPRWLKRGEEFILASFRESISLHQVANVANVCPVHFARTFRKKHGCSVGEFLQDLRLSEACYLIVERGCAAGAAAQYAGFYDQAHLTRTLSHSVGKNTSQLRNSLAPLLAC